MTSPQDGELAVLELLELALGEPSQEREGFVGSVPGYADAARARVLRILAGGSGAASLRTDGVDAFSMALAEPPSRIGAYRIIKEIGRGGMGAVFRAERDQGDFDLTVAIKIIATGKLSSKLVDRFSQERQILARLTHPYIARLYDGGETKDGLPYLVMELVDGQPLQTWLHDDRRQADCFTVLSQILEAVDYAHRKLVIHRDLTPSNVIVTADGDVKIIDFGISSFPSASDAPFITGQTATPGFSAPESRDSDSPSTAIDIYAIGKLIQLMFQRFDAPEMNAIAQKASAEMPEARYGSVAQLADDIERYRSGHPVHAFKGGSVYAAQKYLRRNWLPVAATATIAGILAVSVGLLAQAYRQEQAAQELAANRFDAVRDLARFQLFEVYDALNDIPNTVSARQLVARSSIDYLNNLAITADAPPDLRLEAGQGWLRLSQVTGGSSGDNIGLREDALSYGARALEILEALHEDYRDDANIRYAFGRALAILALDSLYIDGDSDTGLSRAVQAVDLLSMVPPDNEDRAAITARAHRALGDAYGWKNDLPQAGVAYREGLSFVESLPPILQKSQGVRAQTSTLMRQLAEVYRYTGEPEKALAQMRNTVAFVEDVYTDAGAADINVARRSLVIVLWNISDMHRSLSQWDEGLGYAERASALVQTGMTENPKDVGWLDLKPMTDTVFARLKSGKGDHSQAIAAADSAIAAARAIRQVSGANTGSDLSLAVTLKDITSVYRNAGELKTACARLKEADKIFTTYDQAGDLSEYDRENNMAPVREALDSC